MVTKAAKPTAKKSATTAVEKKARAAKGSAKASPSKAKSNGKSAAPAKASRAKSSGGKAVAKKARGDQRRKPSLKRSMTQRATAAPPTQRKA